MSKRGLLFYSKEDVSKNNWFIEELIKVAKTRGLQLSLRVLDNVCYPLFECPLLSSIEKSADEKSQCDECVPSLCSSCRNHIDKLQSTLPSPEGIDVIINRSRNACVSCLYEQSGVRSINSSLVCSIANDKDLTYRYMKLNNICCLDYVSAPNDDLEIIKAADDFGYPFVIKPAHGHGGGGVSFIDNGARLAEKVGEIRILWPKENKILLQRCATDIGKDLRVYSLGNHELAAVMRHLSSSDNTHDSGMLSSTYDSYSNFPILSVATESDTSYQPSKISDLGSFSSHPCLSSPFVNAHDVTYREIRANFSLGGSAALHLLSKEERELFEKISRVLPSDFIGIDFIYDNGIPVFNEIEDAVGCRMLYSVSDIDVIARYIDYIISCL